MATKTNAQRARLIYDVVFGIYTVFVGVLLIWQCWAIYHSAASKPFSVASISAHFQQIQWFVWTWLLGLIANLVLAVIFPEEKGKPRYFDYTAQLRKLRARLSEKGKNALVCNAYSAIRHLLWGICGVAILVSIVICAYFFSNAYIPNSPSAFLSENNGVAERLLHMLPFVSGVAVMFAVVAVCDNFLSLKELSLVKQAVAAEARAKQGKGLGNMPIRKIEKATGAWVDVTCPHCQKKLRLQKVNCVYQCPCCEQRFWAKTIKQPSADLALEKKKKLTVWITRGVLACAAVALIIVGICNGGMMDVLQKAKNICTQCIGLG